MIRKGFPVRFVSWVMKSIEHGKVAVKVNDAIGSYFKSKQGLRQGDPMSPILFDVAVDILTLLVKKASENGLSEGVFTHLVEDGVNMLQYADDIIFMFKHSVESARNLKFILCLFEQMSGLKN
jgi:hypothetical protein